MSNLPTGTVTFFFSDIEGSTRLLQRLGEDYRTVLDRHYEIGRAAFAVHGGVEIRTEGDAFFVVFTDAQAACEAASDFQRGLADVDWPDGGIVKVRIGLHTGIGELGGDDYLGLDVHLAARIAATGHGGQVVVSGATKALARGTNFLDLGSHRLKDIDGSEQLFQLMVPELPTSFPPLRTLDSRPNNLPIMATELIGRDGEKTEVLNRLADNSLVTIVGPGGVGKTHLAVSAASEALAGFDSAHFVDLTPVRDASLVLPAIASSLDVDATGAAEIAHALGDRKRLVLLDNLEQVIDSAPEIGSLLSGCPGLSILATSQVPLRLSGESVFRLQPLGTDDHGPSAAVDLFASRASAADPTFSLSDHADDVAALVAALDGLPLAVELAAARLNVLTPAGILDRLQSGAGVLETRAADAPERHRSLRDAIAWSYDLLSDDQQQVLECLSVFRGGATLEAIETVASRDVLDDLGELVDRSLVRTRTGVSSKRFDLLDGVLRFAEEQVDESAAAEIRESHARYVMLLGAAAEEGLKTDRAARWMAALGDDHENLQAALGRFHQAQDPDRGLRLLGTVWRYFQTAGRIGELSVWLGRFFELPMDGVDPAATALGLSARGAVSYWAQDFDAAIADYEAAVAVAGDAGNQQVEADAWFGLATTFGRAMRIDEAGQAMERTRELYEAVGDAYGLGGVATFSAFAVGATQGVVAAREPLRAASERWEAAGNYATASQVTLGVAGADLLTGDFEEASRQVIRCFDLAERAADRFMLAWGCRGMALGLLIGGDTETGAVLLGASDAARRRMGGGHVNIQFDTGELEAQAAEILDDPALQAKVAEGAELSIERAVEIARQAAGSPASISSISESLVERPSP